MDFSKLKFIKQAIALVVMFTMFSQSVMASTYYVNSIDDTVVGKTCSDGGGDPAGACTLIKALELTNFAPPVGDPRHTVYMNTSGTINMAPSVDNPQYTIIQPTVIDGNGIGDDKVVDINAATNPGHLRIFDIAPGGSGSIIRNFGRLYGADAEIIMAARTSNVEIRDNVIGCGNDPAACIRTGAMGVLVDSSNDITIDGNTISGNGTIGSPVAGVLVDDSNNVQITNNEIEDNAGDGLYVGGTSNNILVQNNILLANYRNITIDNVGDLIIDGNVIGESTDFGTYVSGASSLLFQNNRSGVNVDGSDIHNGADDLRIAIEDGNNVPLMPAAINIFDNIFGYTPMQSVAVRDAGSDDTLIVIQGNYFQTSEDGTQFIPAASPVSGGGVIVCQGKLLFGGPNNLNTDASDIGYGNIVNSSGGFGLALGYQDGTCSSDTSGASEAYVYGNIFGLLKAVGGNYTVLAEGVSGESISIGNNQSLTGAQIGAVDVDSANVMGDGSSLKTGWSVSNSSQLRNVFAGDKINSEDDSAIYIDALPGVLDGDGMADVHMDIINNYIGLDYYGAIPYGFSSSGIEILDVSSTAGVGITIMGNVIAANGDSGIYIEGGQSGDIVEILENYIGVNKDGNVGTNMWDFGNGYGIDHENPSEVGMGGIEIRANDGLIVNIGFHSDTGSPLDEDLFIMGNVISGNSGFGIYVGNIMDESTPVVNILGNIIGLNAAADAAVPNGVDPVLGWMAHGAGIVVVHIKGHLDSESESHGGIYGVGTNVIIGYAAEADPDKERGNVISGNYGAGISILGAYSGQIAANFIGINRDGEKFANCQSPQTVLFPGPAGANGAGIVLMDFGLHLGHADFSSEISNFSIIANQIAGNEGYGISMYHYEANGLNPAGYGMHWGVGSGPNYGDVNSNVIGLKTQIPDGCFNPDGCIYPEFNGTANEYNYGIYIRDGEEDGLIDNITGLGERLLWNIVNGGMYAKNLDVAPDDLIDVYAANYWTSKTDEFTIPQTFPEMFVGYITDTYKHWIVDSGNGDLLEEEHMPTGTQCSDGIDNDGDGLVDLYDDDCDTVDDVAEGIVGEDPEEEDPEEEDPEEEDPVCGNGDVEDGEECDDGNVVDDDGCSARCEQEGGGGGVLIIPPPIVPPTIKCSPGYTKYGNECVKNQIVCPTGTRLSGEECVPITCPDGQHLSGNECIAVAPTCEDGYRLSGNQCVKISTECTGDACSKQGSAASTSNNYVKTISASTVLDKDECKADNDCKSDEICQRSSIGDMKCIERPACDTVEGLSYCLEQESSEKEAADYVVFGLTGVTPMSPSIVNLDGKTVDQNPLILLTYKSGQDVGVVLENSESGEVFEIEVEEYVDAFTGKFTKVERMIAKNKSSEELKNLAQIGNTKIDSEYKGQIAVTAPIPFGKYYATPISSDGMNGKTVQFTVADTGIRVDDLKILASDADSSSVSESNGTSQQYRILAKINSQNTGRKIAYFTYQSVIFASVALTDANEEGEYIDVLVPDYVAKNEQHLLSMFVYDPATKSQSSQSGMKFEMK